MKQLLSAFLLLFSAYANGQSFSDYIKIYGDGEIYQCSVDSVNSDLVILRKKETPFYRLGVPWKQVQGLFISDSVVKSKISSINYSRLLVKHPSHLLQTIGGKIGNSTVPLTDSLSRVALNYHLERAGVNLNAGEMLGLLAVLVGSCNVFATDIKQIKTISGIASGIGLLGIVVRISGGNHLKKAGQKNQYRK